MRPFIHVFRPSLASYTIEEYFKPWSEFLCHMHLIFRGEVNPRYDQTVLTIAEKHGIDIACLHAAKDLFKKMRKDSNLQNEMKFLHHAILIFKGPLKHATWIHDIRMNVQEKFKIRIVQILFSPKLHACESKELEQREKGWCHDFLHKIKNLPYKKIKSMHGLGEK